MDENKFELGRLVATIAVDALMRSNQRFKDFVMVSLYRYINCDWGDTCDADKATNNEALIVGDRILAVYKNERLGKTIWIITEWDRSVTTILFPEDY